MDIRAATAGFLFSSTGFRGVHPMLKNGGPMIFKILPVWLLTWLHPLLTLGFLKMGFSPSTKPEVLEVAKIDSNKNDQSMAVHYSAAMVWLTRDEARDILATVNVDRSASVPITVMHGIDDKICPIRVGEDTVKTINAQPLVKIAKAAFQIYEEQPEVVAESISKMALAHFSSSK